MPAAMTGPAPGVLSGRRLQLATTTLCANPATVLPALCLLLFPLLGWEHLEASKHVSSTVVLKDTPAVPGTVNPGEIYVKEGMSNCTVAHSDSLGQCHGDTAAFRNMPTSPITILGLRGSAQPICGTSHPCGFIFPNGPPPVPSSPLNKGGTQIVTQGVHCPVSLSSLFLPRHRQSQTLSAIASTHDCCLFQILTSIPAPEGPASPA